MYRKSPCQNTLNKIGFKHEERFLQIELTSDSVVEQNAPHKISERKSLISIRKVVVDIAYIQLLKLKSILSKVEFQ